MTFLPIKIQLTTIPNKPGVYQYYDKEGELLYVGKAKNLKKRVSSYFNKQHEIGKTRVLVKKIVSIKHIVVETETDALLLENNLIKKYQPRYNIMLKDDKTYPWICIKKERFPRVFSTRKMIKDGSEYFGPYTNVKTVYTLLELINGLFPLRNCNYDLADKNIKSGKYKVCLEYHLDNCLAANLNFEDAQRIKEKMATLMNYQSKSMIVNSKINNVDVFSIVTDEAYGYVNYLQLSYGSIIRSHTLEIKKKLEETDEQILQISIIELRQRFQSLCKEIYVPFKINVGENLKIYIPKLGDKKRILDLSLRNAKYYRMERFKQTKITDPNRHENRIMSQMKKDLRLSEEPRHIECFDNSNIQGTNPVAACVVFKNGKPSKKEYRKFNIKTVKGPDDFASMEEVVYRRYKRLLEEKQPLPQLIIIDGGKGQLSSSLKSLDKLQLRGKIAIIGIAKRLEELFYPEDPIPLYLDKKSETLKIIQQLRNEAHRFGITFHRDKRSKEALNTTLLTIEGIGEKTIIQLLKNFKSLKRLQTVSFDDISMIVGPSKAQKIIDHYK